MLLHRNACDALALHSTRAPAVRHFINLSNGAEAMPLLAAAGLPPEGVSFIRVQSSHCEAQDFYGLLQNLDHNLLMHLALGFECRVYDFGSRGNYWEAPAKTSVAGAQGDLSDAATEEMTAEPGVELQYVPRAIWWGLEWSRYALNALWKLEAQTPLLRGYNVQALFDEKLRHIPKPLFKRVKYYRSYLAPDLREVRLQGYYAQTLLDGNKDAYRAFLMQHTERATSGTPPLAGEAVDLDRPSSWERPLRRYDANTARRVGEMRGRVS